LANLEKIGLSYAALRRQCLDALRQWPGCESVNGIQVVRENRGRFSIRVTLFGKADKKLADRAVIYIQRENRRRYRLVE
jgi:hypothetical protein